MQSLDDCGDFAWFCAWCGVELNCRSIVVGRRDEVFNVLTGQDIWHTMDVFTFCRPPCFDAYWTGV
jgi:hypothetical protein